MKYKTIYQAVILALGSACAATALAQAPDRTKLPIHEPKIPLSTVFDVRNATPPARFEVKAPAGAPNVLIVLIDDMGFGQSSAFGGPVRMPTAERLADNGLRYNQFHTTALSSPSRMALLTGRNHHTGNMLSITETATGFPGATGKRPESVAPLAMTLRYNGYSTAQFGKNHETAAWETSPSGPTDRWPTRNGFDKFYGFMGGETNQWSPAIYDGMVKIEVPNDPDYHFMTDMTDQSIKWVRSQKSLTPDKPFFMYWAPGASHGPHQVMKEWADKYKGKFDHGWDKQREITFEKQKELGVIPQDTKLTPRPDSIPAWDSCSPDEKRLYSRMQEIFAGFLEHIDAQVARMIDALDTMNIRDDTLIIYIVGDNGPSAEGSPTGTLNNMKTQQGFPDDLAHMLEHIDEIGGPKFENHYPVPWCWAGSSPFQLSLIHI